MSNKGCIRCCCQICTCNGKKHGCFDATPKSLKFTATTTHKEVYQTHELSKHHGLIKKKNQSSDFFTKRPNTPFEGQSIYQSSFIKKDAESVRPCTPKPNLKTSKSELFSATSCYKQDFEKGFNSNTTKKMNPFKPKTNLKVSKNNSFNSTSRYQYDYKPYETIEKVRPCTPISNLKTSSKSTLFNGTSAYKRDYKSYDNVSNIKSKQIKQSNQLSLSKSKFSESSTYQQSFKQHELNANECTCPVIKQGLNRTAKPGYKHHYFTQKNSGINNNESKSVVSNDVNQWETASVSMDHEYNHNDSHHYHQSLTKPNNYFFAPDPTTT